MKLTELTAHSEELERLLAQSVEREHQARQIGAKAADRQRRHRARIREGLTCYRVTLPAVDCEELLASFGASSIQELLEGLIELDKAVTHNAAGLGNLVQCFAEELANHLGTKT